MELEQRLKDALDQEASNREVDLQALYAGARTRITASAPRNRSRGGRWLPPVLVAASVAGIVGAMVLLATLPTDNADSLPADGLVEGGVESAFTCPDLFVYDWTRPETIEDDAFVASLEGGPATQAALHQAPRFAYDEAGDRAFLRFGNADGSLGMLTQFQRVDGAWAPVRTELCAGPDGSVGVPVEDELRLGRHAGAPYPVNALGGPKNGGVLLDDRELYDSAGLVRHRSLYAEPCDRWVCVKAIHSPGSGMSTRIKTTDAGVPLDLHSMFWPPDEMVGKPSTLSFVVLHDPSGDVAAVRAKLADGSDVDARRISDGPWAGRLYALLAPADQLREVVVEPSGDGPARRYLPSELGRI